MKNNELFVRKAREQTEKYAIKKSTKRQKEEEEKEEKEKEKEAKKREKIQTIYMTQILKKTKRSIVRRVAKQVGVIASFCSMNRLFSCCYGSKKERLEAEKKTQDSADIVSF